MKKKILFVIMFMSILLLTFYSVYTRKKAKGEAERARTENLENKTVLTLIWWGEDLRHNAILEAIQKYQECNPSILIQSIYGTVKGQEEYFQDLIWTDNSADISQIQWEWISDDKKEEKFLDLNELAHLIELEQFSKETIEEFTVNGKLLGIPIVSKKLEESRENKMDYAQVVYSISKTATEPEECVKFLEFLFKEGIGEIGMK